MLTAVLLSLAVAPAAEEKSFVAPGAKLEKLWSEGEFTEGPTEGPDGAIYFSDIGNRVMKYDPATGKTTAFRDPGGRTNGLKFDAKGRLVACEGANTGGGRRISVTEKDGTVKALADKFDGKRFNSPNDVAVRSDGTLWFTDPPWGLTEKGEQPGHFVFKLDPKTGKVEAVLKDLAMPNGIVFSPDQSRLYVADTGGNARHPDPAFHKLPAGIHCYEVSKDGTLGKKLFTIPEGSDGMKVDAKGNLYTTHGKVKIYDPAGKLLEAIDVPEGPANLCFGGEDYKTLFITARTSLYSVRMVNPGLKPAGAK